jgi:hypothetical protein
MYFDTQQTPVFLVIYENKYFQSCHASRAFTRAGFKSAPLSNIQTGCSSIIKYVRAYTSVRSGDTTYPGRLLT